MVTVHTGKQSPSSTGKRIPLCCAWLNEPPLFRSEVVGRPLAALLSNDGARVFSADIDSIQEYTKRTPTDEGSAARRYHPHHVVHPCSKTLQECLAISDVVISAVPSESYKVETKWLKDGCVCVNVSSEKNFEKDVRDKVSSFSPWIPIRWISLTIHLWHFLSKGVDIPARRRKSDNIDAATQSVSYTARSYIVMTVDKILFHTSAFGFKSIMRY